jgi:hypothetical protein
MKTSNIGIAMRFYLYKIKYEKQRRRTSREKHKFIIVISNPILMGEQIFLYIHEAIYRYKAQEREGEKITENMKWGSKSSVCHTLLCTLMMRSMVLCFVFFWITKERTV